VKIGLMMANSVDLIHILKKNHAAAENVFFEV
jgi:hypothetical protein